MRGWFAGIGLMACLVGGGALALELPATPVKVVAVQRQALVDAERAVGRVESLAAPLVAAEVAGRVAALLVEEGAEVVLEQPLVALDDTPFRHAREARLAERERLEALLVNQRRVVERLRQLRKLDAASRERLEGAETELAVLAAQHTASLAQLAEAERQLRRCILTAPVAGRVEKRLVTVGDYVAVGNPLLRLTTTRRLRAVLPFPEGVAGRLLVGQEARVHAALAPERPAQGVVTALRPSVGAGSRAVEALVEFDPPAGWRPGASILGEVTVARRDQSLVVPERSVVLRPAGEVVYLLEGDQVRQRPVRTGLRRDGVVELLAGVVDGDRVVSDGAGFLTDGARVREVK